MIRLALRVPAGQAELVLAELLELAPGGVEELELEQGAVVEYAVYGAPGELPGLPDLNALAGGALVEISTSEVADDWQERWRRFHRPVTIEAPAGSGVPSIRVRPPWEPAEPPSPARLELAIDPGQAFGTGGHATTRLCLGLLQELVAAGGAGPVLDVGCGSGVLAIAAAKLGLGPLLGLDNEQQSVEAATENAAANGVELAVERFDLRGEALPWLGRDRPGPPGGGEPIVLANLLAPLLVELCGAMARAPSHLIAGGMLEHELDGVAETFLVDHGLREVARRTRGGWGALWLAHAI